MSQKESWNSIHPLPGQPYVCIHGLQGHLHPEWRVFNLTLELAWQASCRDMVKAAGLELRIRAKYPHLGALSTVQSPKKSHLTTKSLKPMHTDPFPSFILMSSV